MADDEVVEAPEISEGASEDTAASGGASSDSESWSPAQQAEYTKKTQALADERKSWEGERSQQQQQLHMVWTRKTVEKGMCSSTTWEVEPLMCPSRPLRMESLK